MRVAKLCQIGFSNGVGTEADREYVVQFVFDPTERNHINLLFRSNPFPNQINFLRGELSARPELDSCEHP